MKRAEAIAYLTRCADDNGTHWYQGRAWSDPETCPTCHGTNDAGWLGCPGSRYGRTSARCAPVAYKLAVIRTGDYNVSASELDSAMSQVVNDSETPQAEMTEYALGLARADIDAIVNGYLTCQLWAGVDLDREDTPPLDENYGLGDISTEYVDKVRDELLSVVTEHPLAVRMYLNYRGWYHTGVNGQIVRMREDRPQYDRNELFGHDFYLTREGHGAGFWDRGLGELGDYLTKIAKAYGSAEELFDNGEGILS